VAGVIGTEVRRPLSPVERWFWIADQVSPLNVIARVRVTGHFPERVLERAATDLAAEYPVLQVAIRADAVRRVLTATQLDTVLRRCRQEGVTVHSALAAKMAMVIGPTAAQRPSGRLHTLLAAIDTSGS
jgi:hypothetical protein